MDISDNKRVNEFLLDVESLSKIQFEMVIAIRILFLKANKALIEDVKYGGIVFSGSNGLVGGIYVYKEHISIEFSDGANFTDLNSILEGSGKKRRHLKIYSQEDVALKNSNYFIKQAASNEDVT